MTKKAAVEAVDMARVEAFNRGIQDVLFKICEEKKVQIYESHLNYGEAVLSVGFKVSLKNVANVVKIGGKMSFSTGKEVSEVHGSLDLDQQSFNWDDDAGGDPGILDAPEED